ETGRKSLRDVRYVLSTHFVSTFRKPLLYPSELRGRNAMGGSDSTLCRRLCRNGIGIYLPPRTADVQHGDLCRTLIDGWPGGTNASHSAFGLPRPRLVPKPRRDLSIRQARKD